MRKLALFGLVSLLLGCEKPIEKIKTAVTIDYFKPLIEHLTADSLLGRDTGSAGIQMAADILVKEFEDLGTNYVPGKSSYRQKIAFFKRGEIKSVSADLGKGNVFTFAKNQIGVQAGNSADIYTESIVLETISEEDAQKGLYANKIVVTLHQAITNSNYEDVMKVNQSTYEFLEKAGAAAFVQIMPINKNTWKGYFARLNKSKLSTKKPSGSMPYLLIDNGDLGINRLRNQKKARIILDVEPTTTLNDANIAAFIPGTDSKLKDEIILVSAHYDHVGFKTGMGADQDSIYNGARDNAVGAVALLVGAKVLKSVKPKRSVLFLAVTGEELGLLGSSYYVENPLYPLNKTVFNLNLDGAGYNDTSIVTLVGLGNYKQDSLIANAVQEMGIKPILDPVPQFNLFVRSDNINFTELGIPSITYSLGFTEFSDELMKVYHKPSDEASTLDYDYLKRFYEGFAHALVTLANNPQRMEWRDDKSWAEKAKVLYGK